jgi:hypothetical protein
MLPQLFTLRTTQVVGHLLDTTPESVNCSECGRQIAEYESYLLVLDTLPRCDIIESAGTGYFVSESLLIELERAKVIGYSYHEKPTPIEISRDFRRSYTNSDELLENLAVYHYFMITGRCDGPWIENVLGASCSACGQPVPVRQDLATYLARISGKIPEQPRLVFPHTWHGEDFFLVSEPGAPIVTQTVVDILERTGNLRVEAISPGEQAYIRQTMPQHAETLARKHWQRAICHEVGPAGWVEP